MLPGPFPPTKCSMCTTYLDLSLGSIAVTTSLASGLLRCWVCGEDASPHDTNPDSREQQIKQTEQLGIAAPPLQPNTLKASWCTTRLVAARPPARDRSAQHPDVESIIKMFGVRYSFPLLLFFGDISIVCNRKCIIITMKCKTVSQSMSIPMLDCPAGGHFDFE